MSTYLFSGFQFHLRRYLTECYDELGTQYKVPIYCLSYPINIVKEDNGRDSPAEYSEPVDGGQEVILKLRLSSSFADTKLIVYSKDTIGQCKKKLQVCGSHAMTFCLLARSICVSVCVSIFQPSFDIFRLHALQCLKLWLENVQTTYFCILIFDFFLLFSKTHQHETNEYTHTSMTPIRPSNVIHTQSQTQTQTQNKQIKWTQYTHTGTRECRCMLSALVLRWEITWR